MTSVSANIKADFTRAGIAYHKAKAASDAAHLEAGALHHLYNQSTAREAAARIVEAKAKEEYDRAVTALARLEATP